MSDDSFMSGATSGKLEVILNDQAQAALDNFSVCFGARIAFYNPDQQELNVGLAKPGCRYCSMIRKDLKSEDLCRQQDRAKFNEASQRRTLVHYTCHGGMVEAICPIYISGTLAGYVMVGQLRTVDAPPGQWCRRSVKEWGDDREFRRAFNEVPKIPAEKIPAILGLFSLLVKVIVEEGIGAVKGDLVVERILHEVRSHPERPLTLTEAANLVGRSYSAVSHLFKARIGRSFKACTLDIRMEKAEELLRHEPGLTVKEAAMKVGYEDEFYFSRLFRKRRGCPPSRIARKPAAV